MKETKIVLTVQHKKPLPDGVTDVIAQRFYMWAYSQGCEVGVNAEVLLPLPVKEMTEEAK
jgi:hypothetical protein